MRELRAEHLTKRFGKTTALDDVSLSFEYGKIHALLGRNGAGKTTLLKLIAGTIDADEGRRTIVPGTRVVLLEQDPNLAGFATLADYVMSGSDAPQHF